MYFFINVGKKKYLAKNSHSIANCTTSANCDRNRLVVYENNNLRAIEYLQQIRRH